MNKDCNLFQIIKTILKIDISFILEDIIGDFTDIEMPANIDLNNFSIDIDTLKGPLNMRVLKVGSHYEIYFKRIASPDFYEEYHLNLNPYDEDFFYLNGTTIELRSKGIIVNKYEKLYNSDDLTNDSEKNRIIYESGNLNVNSLAYVSKTQGVYPNRELYKVHRKKLLDSKSPEEKFALLKTIKEDLHRQGIYPTFNNTVIMNLPVTSNSKYDSYLNVRINGYDNSWMYSMCPNKPNIVGRAFKLYQGIITSENYDDALHLIKSGKFSKTFSYENYQNTVESTNQIISGIVGEPLSTCEKEYSKEVVSIVENYYKSIESNPFLFDECSSHSTDKKRELRKNEYIRQILLINHENI